MKRFLIATVLGVAGFGLAGCGDIDTDEGGVQTHTTTLGAKADKESKVVMCHIPPGNPDNAHEIEISLNARANVRLAASSVSPPPKPLVAREGRLE